MKKIIVTVVIAMLSGVFFLPVPVSAMEEPLDVTLYNITIFKDIIDENDFLAIVPYDIPFASQPDDDINNTFIFSMLSPDKSMQLGSVLAYPRYDGGYWKGIVSFYFQIGTTWESNYVFRVQENPSHYPSPQTWDFVVGTSDYSSDSNQVLALRAKLLDSALELSTEWSVDLLSTGDAGQTVLSTYGELYYLNAVPGLQMMCPTLFSVQIETPDYTKRSWSYTLAESLRIKYAGTWIADFMTGFAGLFNMNTNTAMDFLSIFIFVLAIIISIWKFRATTMAAFIDGYDVLLLLMLNGFFSMIYAGLMAFLSVVLGSIILFINRG